MIEATRPGGLQELQAFLNRSKYLRGDGKGEVMVSLRLRPTGNKDELSAQFTVPARKPESPLPEGPYRLELQGGIDGNGQPFHHPYIPIGSISFDPEPGKPWLVKFEPRRYSHGESPLPAHLSVSNRRREQVQLNYTVTVTDYFSLPACETIRGSLTVPGDGQVVHQPLKLPVGGNANQYRVQVTVVDQQQRKQEIASDLMADVSL